MPQQENFSSEFWEQVQTNCPEELGKLFALCSVKDVRIVVKKSLSNEDFVLLARALDKLGIEWSKGDKAFVMKMNMPLGTLLRLGMEGDTHVSSRKS